MGKKYFLAILLVGIQVVSAVASVLGEPKNHENPPSQVDLCTAPPPDSFRITGLGYNFVSLAWNPITPGDNHLLSIFIQNASNGWDILYTVQLSNATTYTATGIDHTKAHQIEIRTLCSNGEPGTLSPTLWPPHGLILELVVGGRTPNAPQAISNCDTAINYVANNWVGFRLTKIVDGGLISSLFEFEKINFGDSQGRIKRLCEYNPLVAATWENIWPNSFTGPIPTDDYTFKIGEVKQGIFNGFGKVDVAFPVDNFVQICTPPLPAPYNFQLLVSNSVQEAANCAGSPGGIKSVGFVKKESKMGLIHVQNPASEYLNLFLSEDGFESGLYKFTLVDMNGKICFRELIEAYEPVLSIPTNFISAGFFFLRVEFKENVQNLKVIINN